MLLLATNPEAHDRAFEEVREVTKNPRSPFWEYEELFGKLNRCRAVLLETLRLFAPIVALPK